MGLLSTAAKAAVFSSVHGRVQRRQQERWAAQDQARQPAAIATEGVAPLPPAPEAMRSKLELLAQLGQLRDAGILDDAEFAAKKAEILGS